MWKTEKYSLKNYTRFMLLPNWINWLIHNYMQTWLTDNKLLPHKLPLTINTNVTYPAKIAAIFVIIHSGELKPRIPTPRNGSSRNCSHTQQWLSKLDSMREITKYATHCSLPTYNFYVWNSKKMISTDPTNWINNNNVHISILQWVVTRLEAVKYHGLNQHSST